MKSILLIILFCLVLIYISQGKRGKVTYTTPGGKTYTLFNDMLSQPHLLIAGATGSGKSVVINGLIATLLHRLPFDRKDGAALILIDPKRVELVKYKSLPHTVRYASEPDSMLSALQYAMQITEDRYKKMQRNGETLYSGGDLFVIVDEFADLMTTQGKAIVPLVQRLAQIGRAAKVHLIIATQTPVREIIPTKIKCNFDARVGLRTRSAQDSRNILGVTGCESLPRYGQGYYMTPEGTKGYIIPYVQQEEIDALLAHWRQQHANNTTSRKIIAAFE